MNLYRRKTEADLTELERMQTHFHGRPIALNEFVPVLSECPTCEGKGFYVVQSTRGPMETDDIECPDCGGWGVRIPDEWVEAVAFALWVEDSKATPENYAVYGHLTERSRRGYRRQALAVWPAVLDCIEREEA